MISYQKKLAAICKIYLTRFYFLLSIVFCFNVSNAQNWHWQNPLPQGVNLYGVYFTDANIGYSVGLDGVILKTTDAGVSWTAQNSGTSNSLLGVHFINADTGYVVGASSTCLKTTDGGLNWTLMPASSPYLTSVFFTDANTGYAVGSNGSASIIIKTTNGGLTWTAQNTTPVTYYNSVYFCNDSTGYVVGNGGKILKTTNGGNTWTQQISGVTTSLFSVYFTDENHGYVGDYGRILRTSDGGATWTYLTIFQSYELYGMYFTDSNTGYAVGRSGKILKTTNSGVNWTFLNSGTSINLRSVYFTDLNHGYAVGESGIMLKTSDAGITWNSFTPMAYFEKLNEANFPSSCTGYAVGDFGKILKTVNGGTDWIIQNGGINNNLNAVFFTDDNTGYAVGDFGKILKTVNGGTDWIAQNSNINNNLKSVYFTDENVGYAVADSGKIIKTIDGGSNWVTQNSGLTGALNSVFFTGADTGYAVGFNGKILKTIDGGNNWLALTNNDSQSLYSIYFVDANLGYAAGNSGRVLKTIDAGATWNILYTATTLDLKSIYFTSATVGYLSGVSGHIRKTVNGGTSWTQLTNNINFVITSLSFIDDNTGYAVGYDYNDYGQIYYTTNGGTNWTGETISWEHELFSVDYVDANTVYIVGNNGAILKSILGDISAGNNGPVCEGAPITLSASTVAGANYLWTGPNGFTSTQQNPLISANATTAMSGSYQVTAAINLCTNLSQTTMVEVIAFPSALAPSNNGPVCEGTLLGLNAATLAGATYSWTGPNGFTSTQQNPIVDANVTIAMSGNYSVTAAVNGCTSSIETTTVIVNTTPSALAPNSNGPVCENTPLDLSAATIAGATYNWTGPNGFTSTQQNPTVNAIATAAMSGAYEVTATLNGCTSATETTIVAVNAIPSAPIPSSNGPVCEGTSLDLSATTIAGASYYWTGPNGFTSTQQNPTLISIAGMSGNYEVTATVNGCTSLAEATAVIVHAIPTAPLVSNNGPVDEADTLVLSATTIVGASYLWTGPDGFTSTLQNPTVSNAATLTMAGNYFVTVTVNGCTSEADSTLVIVNTTVGANNLIHKNSISIFPNPTSEQLTIKYDGIKSMKIEIFNSIGAIVFQGILYHGSNLIDVKAFADAIYTIRFTDTDGIYYQKLIKN